MPNLLADHFDPTFQSTSKKLILPTNRRNQADYDNLHEEQSGVNDFSSDELMKLLSFMEGEVQAREDVIEHLKKERTKILLSEAKYGKLNMNDPFAALRRDSAISEEQIDEEKIVQMYESQVDQLDKMMAIQKKSQRNAAVLLVALEKKQYKLVKKLEADREAKIRYAKQGDDLVAHLEKERNQLQQQIEFHIEEKRKAEIAKDKMEMTLGNEKKRHESIVLYLIQERKQMLLKMHELRVKAEQLMLQNQSDPNKPGPSNALNERELIEELKKEVTFLRGERDSLTKTQKIMKTEHLNLRETIRGQEADLHMLRRNLTLTGAKMSIDKPGNVLPQLAPDGGSLVMANRGAKPANARQPPAPPAARIPNSSTFPTEKSRLPRAPPPPTTVPVPRMSVGNIPASSSNVPRTMSSPIKKTPVMGVSSTAVRRPQSATTMPTTSIITNTSAVMPLSPELEQLEAAIQSMNVVSSSPPAYSTAIMAKRSSSLPREPNNNPPPIRRSTMNGGGMHSSTTGVVTTRIAGPSTTVASERKMSGTVKRNGILAKAFGSSK